MAAIWQKTSSLSLTNNGSNKILHKKKKRNSNKQNLISLASKTICLYAKPCVWSALDCGDNTGKKHSVRITNVRQARLLSPLLTLFTKATIFPPILTSYFTTIVTVCRQVQHEHYAALWIHAFEIFWIFLYISLTATHLFKNMLKIHHVKIWFAWDISLHSLTNRNVQIYVIKLRYS